VYALPFYILLPPAAGTTRRIYNPWRTASRVTCGVTHLRLPRPATGAGSHTSISPSHQCTTSIKHQHINHHELATTGAAAHSRNTNGSLPALWRLSSALQEHRVHVVVARLQRVGVGALPVAAELAAAKRAARDREAAPRTGDLLESR
jgi:hypothetical protein